MSVAQKKTPGVYIVEENAFPNSVVEVPTGIPVFVGYTEIAKRGDDDLTGVPTRISSFNQYLDMFGGAPPTIIKATTADGKTTFEADPNTRFLMYQALQFFFMNGGGDCWIVSVGGYMDDGNPRAKLAKDLTEPLHDLEKILEPAIIHAPDMVNCDSWATAAQEYLLHCMEMQSRVAILDIVDGNKPRDFTPNDVIDKGFREDLGAGASGLNYGMAYYPWVDTTVTDLEEIGLEHLDQSARDLAAAKVEAEKVANPKPGSPDVARNAQLDALVNDIKTAPAPPRTTTQRTPRPS